MFLLQQLAIALLSTLLQEPYTVKVDVPVVSLDAVVSDAKGALVNDLTKADFQILEDGIPQEIRFFSPVSAPYNVFLLFDRSQSVQEHWSFMKNAVNKFVQDLRPQDLVALGAFDESFTAAAGWTTERTRVMTALDKVMSRPETNGTRFYAALERTLRREFKNVVGRRAIVVLTDGKDTDFSPGIFEQDLKKALKASKEERIPIYIIALQEEDIDKVQLPNTREYLIELREFMQQLTEVSGGQILFPKNLEDVAGMYDQIGRALGTSYSIGYIPAATSSSHRHRIEVKTRNGGLRITQSRSEY